jgi:hypothetical protein
MINRWVYTLYFLGLVLYLCYVSVSAVLFSSDLNYFSVSTIAIVAVMKLLLPIYFLWRLYNYYIKREPKWLPQLEDKKSWYVIVGLCLMWPIVLLGIIFLVTLIIPDAAAMAAAIILGVASLFKYLPIILIEIGYLNARNQNT